MASAARPAHIEAGRRTGAFGFESVGIIDEKRKQVAEEQREGTRQTGIEIAGIVAHEPPVPNSAPAHADHLVSCRHIEYVEPRLDARVPEGDRKARLQARDHVKVVVEIGRVITGHDAVILGIAADLLGVVPVHADKISSV